MWWLCVWGMLGPGVYMGQWGVGRVDMCGSVCSWSSGVFRGVGAVSRGGAAGYSGVGGYSWAPVLRHEIGLRVRIGAPLGR